MVLNQPQQTTPIAHLHLRQEIAIKKIWSHAGGSGFLWYRRWSACYDGCHGDTEVQKKVINEPRNITYEIISLHTYHVITLTNQNGAIQQLRYQILGLAHRNNRHRMHAPIFSQ